MARKTLFEALPTLTLGDAMYDRLVWIVQLVLPAFGTLYFAVAKIWGLPYAEEVVGTIIALAAFLGVILGISKAQYDADETNYDGTLRVNEAGDVHHWTFVADDLDKLASSKKAKFKVARSQ